MNYPQNRPLLQLRTHQPTTFSASASFYSKNRYNITRGRGFGERLDNTTDDAEIDVRDQENHVSNRQKQD
ncbi:unnamed protein product [Caenorhabditis auriculariae]|uniref:Uncharacterized protein n=1 Tax=Caenorhabditis auriculariae TaxID=2777116 RepID=A0A8S1HC32_9PELO|nr:unnamed protein product [Caenorhabditis auriculariae]